MRLSINKTFKNKPRHSQFKTIGRTFQNVDVSHRELAQLIHEGYSFCSQIKNNWKKASNFLCADYLAVDIDHGVTLDEILNDEYTQKYCSFIYTTVNHSEENNRFRIIFELEEGIEDGQRMKHALSGISKKYGGDPSCTDPCRMFYGAEGCDVHYIDKTLSKEQMEELIEHGKESSKPSDFEDTKSNHTRSSIISRNIISQDTLVIDAGGQQHRLIDLPKHTRIRCPVHTPDNNPSAFITESKTGVVGVHCMKCNTTYFTSKDNPLYDFDYNLNKIKKIQNTQTRL